MSSFKDDVLITGISVRNLFGKRSYDIDVPYIDGNPTRLLLLHGDNGSGKTTLLRLVWHALSAADNRGHRTFIARTPFTELSIKMTGGRRVDIAKTEGLLGGFTLTVLGPGRAGAPVHFDMSDGFKVRSRMRSRGLGRPVSALIPAEFSADYLTMEYADQLFLEDEQMEAERDYFEFLRQDVGSPLYLADDRTLYTDDPEITRLRDMLTRREDGDRRDRGDRLSRLALIELQVALRRVNEHLQAITIGGQNDGSANSNAIYMNVLRQLVDASHSGGDGDDQGPPVEELLAEITKVSPGYERYGLVPPFDAEEFQHLLARAQGAELVDLTERVISPFLSSLRARHDALKDAHDLLDSLVPTANEFLVEKELRFTPRGGLRIVTPEEEVLEVEALSSGERQLLMLLCTTLLAGLDTRLFIIDEPELSLGVDWQRKILDSLIALTDRSRLQFMVATHSIEIISGRPESLVQLRQL